MKTVKDAFEEVSAWVEVPADNKKGFKIKYVYSGPWYIWRTEPEEIQKSKVVIGILCLLDMILFAAAGLMPGSVNTVKWVEIPGLFSLLALVYEITGVVAFCRSKEKMLQPDFRRIKTYLGAAPVVRGVLTLATAAGSVYAIGMTEVTAYHIATTVLFLLSSVASLIMWKRFVKIPHTSEKNDILKHIHDGVLEDGIEAYFL